MSLPDFPHVGQSEASYVTSQEVLRYFEDYADHFELKKYIKVSFFRITNSMILYHTYFLCTQIFTTKIINEEI